MAVAAADVIHVGNAWNLQNNRADYVDDDDLD